MLRYIGSNGKRLLYYPCLSGRRPRFDPIWFLGDVIKHSILELYPYCPCSTSYLVETADDALIPEGRRNPITDWSSVFKLYEGNSSFSQKRNGAINCGEDGCFHLTFAIIQPIILSIWLFTEVACAVLPPTSLTVCLHTTCHLMSIH